MISILYTLYNIKNKYVKLKYSLSIVSETSHDYLSHRNQLIKQRNVYET